MTVPEDDLELVLVKQHAEGSDLLIPSVDLVSTLELLEEISVTLSDLVSELSIVGHFLTPPFDASVCLCRLFLSQRR